MTPGKSIALPGGALVRSELPVEGELGGPGVDSAFATLDEFVVGGRLDLGKLLNGKPLPPATSGVVDLGSGVKVSVNVDMKPQGVTNEERNVPDHLVSASAKTVLFQFETWAVTADGDPCTIQEQLMAFLHALGRVPGHTVTRCTNHSPCGEAEDCSEK